MPVLQLIDVANKKRFDLQHLQTISSIYKQKDGQFDVIKFNTCSETYYVEIWSYLVIAKKITFQSIPGTYFRAWHNY